MTDYILFAVLYTILAMVVSAIYYLRGKNDGQRELMSFLYENDRESFERIRDKVEEMFNGSSNT